MSLGRLEEAERLLAEVLDLMVCSPLDGLKVARQNPDKRVASMAIGFETTAPSTAMTVLRAAAEGIDTS